MPIVLVLTLSTVLFVASKGNRVLVTLAAVDAGAGPLQTGILFALHGLFPLLLAVPACAFAVIPLTGNPWLLTPLAFIIGFGIGCGQPLSMMLAFNAAPEGRSAEAIAMRLAVSYGAHVVLPPLFGALGAATGLAPVFWMCSAALAGGSMMNARQPRKTP